MTISIEKLLSNKDFKSARDEIQKIRDKNANEAKIRSDRLDAIRKLISDIDPEEVLATTYAMFRAEEIKASNYDDVRTRHYITVDLPDEIRRSIEDLPLDNEMSELNSEMKPITISEYDFSYNGGPIQHITDKLKPEIEFNHIEKKLRFGFDFDENAYTKVERGENELRRVIPRRILDDVDEALGVQGLDADPASFKEWRARGLSDKSPYSYLASFHNAYIVEPQLDLSDLQDNQQEL